MKYSIVKDHIWIIKLIVVLITYHLSFITSSAQTFTQRIQKSNAGEGTITIHQDQTIDDLVNAPIVTAKPKPNANKPIGTKTKPTTTQKTKETPVASSDDNIDNIAENSQTSDSLDTTPKHLFKTIGYRVQVLAGGNTRQDRQRAEQARRSLRSLFPGEEVYVHFYSPRWICRLGNYRTYEEAHEKMEEVRKLGYSSATIVKGKITVSE